MAQHKLVIAEKPSVAQNLAAVIGATVRKDGYLEGNGWRVSWCVGHLAGLADADSYDPKYAKWRYDDLPILPEHWQMVVGKDKKKQFDILKKLMNAPDHRFPAFHFQKFLHFISIQFMQTHLNLQNQIITTISRQVFSSLYMPKGMDQHPLHHPQLLVQTYSIRKFHLSSADHQDQQPDKFLQDSSDHPSPLNSDHKFRGMPSLQVLGIALAKSQVSRL